MEPQPLSTWGLISYVWSHWGQIQDAWALVVTTGLTFLGTIVSLASLITPFTKTPEDDKIVSKLKSIMHQFAVTNPK